MNYPMSCPNCSNAMAWIDNGPRLQYWYCRDCKKELDELKKEPPAPIPHEDEYPNFNYQGTVSGRLSMPNAMPPPLPSINVLRLQAGQQYQRQCKRGDIVEINGYRYPIASDGYYNFGSKAGKTNDPNDIIVQRI